MSMTVCFGVCAEYFANILNHYKAKRELGTVYITAEPAMKQDPIVVEIMQSFGAKWHGGNPSQDHYLARIAPIFIGCFGTFSVCFPVWQSSNMSVFPFCYSFLQILGAR